ncbi:MAG TPA: AraC family transcriptional regulator [Casimicrobiaceae bacterium]|jgi:AraC family transcriptional regulator
MPSDSLLRHGQNFGAIVNTVTSGDLCINAAEHVPGMIVPRHEHLSPYVCVVMDGCLEVQARESFECPAGSVIAYPGGHVHANRFSDHHGRCINVHFGSIWTDEGPTREWLRDCRRVHVGMNARALMRLEQEMRANDSAAPLAAASAAIELLAQVMRADSVSSHPKWVARVIDIVEADLAHAPTLGQLAIEVGAHPAHVARAFRRAYGETIGAYVRRRRVEHADRALLTSDMPLAHIAAAAGFSDQAHFTRVYRRHFGVPPGARRRQRNSCSTRVPNIQDATPSRR